MSGWKRLAIIAACAGGGAVFAAFLVAWGFYRYNRRSFRKDWPPKDLPEARLRASLRTEVRAGKALYRFTVEPESADFQEGFATIAKDSSKGSESFTVTLLDSGDFELCRVLLGTSELQMPASFVPDHPEAHPEAVAHLSVNLKDQDKISTLKAEGVLPCSAGDYREASKWAVSHDEWEIVSKSGPPPGYREVPRPKSFVPDRVIPDPLPANGQSAPKPTTQH